DLRHLMNKLDDQLGHCVAGSCLSADDEGSRNHVQGRVALKPVVKDDYEEHEQKLPLIFMHPLDLNIEQRVRRDAYPKSVADKPGQRLFVMVLRGSEPLSKGAVIGKLFQFAQLFEIGDPAIADCFGDQTRERRIGLQEPAPRRYPVRLVVEFRWPMLGEIAKNRCPKKFGME